MALLIDAAIIFAYFACIIFIGLRLGRRDESLRDFALGGRRVPWWAVMASIIAAETSAATYLGTPGEGYAMRSLAYAQIVIGLILGRVLVGYFFLKPYYDYKVYTVYDYLGIRFGPMSKNYVSALFLFMRTLASGTRLFVPSLVMVLAWGLFVGADRRGTSAGSVPSVAPYLVAIVLLTMLTCLYTAVGGIKAVIWTDVVQAALMFGTALLAIATLLYHIGGDSWNLFSDGLSAVTRHVPEMTRSEGYFIFGWEDSLVEKWQATNHVAQMTPWEWIKLTLASPYTLFSALIANAAMNIAAFGTDQDMVQRLLTAETYKKSRRSLITAAVMDLPIYATFTFIGILLIAFYAQRPELKPAGNANLFAAYILNVLPSGIRGLVLAGVFATAMGSLSAALNALATSATNDWYIPYVARHRRDERHHVAAARWFTALFAFLMILIASVFAYATVTNPSIRIIPVVLGIASFILGPMLGVFLLGMFTKRRGSDAGNILAITCGLIATIVLGHLHVELANLFTKPGTFSAPAWLPKVAFTWFALIGAVVVVIVGLFFRTPEHVLVAAQRQREEAHHDDRPVALRE